MRKKQAFVVVLKRIKHGIYLYTFELEKCFKDNTDWVVLPVANFDCYYGNTNFSKKWLSKIPDTILTREVSNGVSRIKVNI